MPTYQVIAPDISTIARGPEAYPVKNGMVELPEKFAASLDPGLIDPTPIPVKAAPIAATAKKTPVTRA